MADSLGATQEVARTEPPDEIQAVPVRHPGRWIAAAVIVVLVATLARSVATNHLFYWGIVGDYLFSSRIFNGLVVTCSSRSCSGTTSRRSTTAST